MATVLTALFTSVIISFIAPYFLAKQLNAARKLEKQEDWKREDDVRMQAQEAAKLLLEENKKVAAAAVLTNGKLDIIHTLVNSNMTAAMQSELDATIRELAMMKEVIGLKEAAGHSPSPDTLGAVKFTDKKIKELQAGLSDRLRQSKVVDSQQAAARDALAMEALGIIKKE